MAERREKRRSVKQRIRDTKRLLSKEDLPETVRLTKERVLKCLATELEEKQREARDKKLSKKYRMVKFFDKRKVVRKLKSGLREWSDCTEAVERTEVLCVLQQLRRELNYVVHYPPGEKYLALYPSTETTDTSALAKRDQLLQQVVEMVVSGELPDASTALLPPALQTHLSLTEAGPHGSSGSVSSATALPSLSSGGRAHRLEPESDSGCGFHEPASRVLLASGEKERKQKQKSGRERTFGKNRSRVLTAAVDDEPEGDPCVLLTESKRKLVHEDDFFMLDSSS